MSSSTCITSNTNFEPEPEPRFPRSGRRGEVVVVDSKSCRQLYLRTAYTFTRQEEKEKDGIEKAKKCLGRVKDRVTLRSNNHHNNKGIMIYSKVKEFSYASLMSMLRRMLACTAKVDVADH
ncbi:Lipoxygenase 3 chloroplastic [Bienertia sinuspersici]